MAGFAGAALVAALLLTGCGAHLYRATSLRSFDQRIAHAYGVHEQILQTVPGAITVGHITEANGVDVMRIANAAREVLDRARTLDIEGRGVAADQSLRLGWDVLIELDQFLKSQRPKSFIREYEEWQRDKLDDGAML